MAMQTLTAVFTSRDGAIAAACELRRRGLSGTVALSPEGGASNDAATDTSGFRAWLGKLLGSAADRDAYSEALGRGETVLTAVVTPAMTDGALGVLNHHLSTRIDRCRPAWRDVHDHGAWPMERASDDGLSRRLPTIQATLTQMSQLLSPVPSDGGKGVP